MARAFSFEPIANTTMRKKISDATKVFAVVEMFRVNHERFLFFCS